MKGTSKSVRKGGPGHQGDMGRTRDSLAQCHSHLSGFFKKILRQRPKGGEPAS